MVSAAPARTPAKAWRKLRSVQGRGWRGFHHHASLCIAAYGFLVAERCLFPPQRRFTRQRFAAPALPKGFRPRGAAGPA